MATSLRKSVPQGKFRVISVDQFGHTEALVIDCDTLKEALDIARKHNAESKLMEDDFYYVYDDQGNLKTILDEVVARMQADVVDM